MIIICVLYHLCSREFVFHTVTLIHMREWLSGGAPPCQGGGRGFDPRLALCQITKRTFPDWEVLFCYLRSAMHFLNSYCFAVWVRFLRALKRSSVVPMQRSTGPLGTRLAYSNISIIFSLAEYHFLLSKKCDALLELILLKQYRFGKYFLYFQQIF